ncbi:MAG TPA: hypothetical protein VNL95_03080 [Dehalococcoidia bacterium]|nr:hypothetical protein [Dehalococcoidia bacterium]
MRRALNILEQSINERGWLAQASVWEVDSGAGNGSPYLKRALKPDANVQVMCYEDEIAQSDEFSRFFEALKQEFAAQGELEWMRRPVAYPDEKKACLRNLVRPALVAYVKESFIENYGFADMDTSRAIAVLEDLLLGLKNELITYRAIAPLVDLSGPGDEIKVDDCLALCPLNTNTVLEILNTCGADLGNFYLRWHHSLKCAYAFVYTYEVAWGSPTVPNVDLIRDALSALRVLKAGDVDVPLVYARPDSARLTNCLGFVAWAPLFTKPFGQSRYLLSIEDVPLLKQVYMRIRRLPPSARERIALDRLNMVYERLRPQDQLIDSWVGLEALLNIESEIRFRTALRLAFYLGNDANDREKLYTAALATYDARSRTVHGRRVDDPQAKADQAVELLRRCLRKALLDGLPNWIEFDKRQIVVGGGA